MNQELDYVEFELKDGIIFTQTIPNLKIDLKTAKEIVKKRIEFQKGKAYPVFFHFTTPNVEKEARNYLNKEGIESIKKGAFFIDSFITSTVINFYLKVYKPKVPAKMFTNKEKAIKWLKE